MSSRNITENGKDERDTVDQDWWLRLLSLRHADPVSTNDLRAVRAAVDEIERLRALITAWADNRDERDGFPWGLEPREAKERDDARWARSKEIESALRKAVGR